MAPIAQPPLRDKLLGSLSAEAAACPLPSRKFLGQLQAGEARNALMQARSWLSHRLVKG